MQVIQNNKQNKSDAFDKRYGPLKGGLPHQSPNMDDCRFCGKDNKSLPQYD